MSWRWIAFDYVLFHHCSIHMNSSVEDTLNFSNSEINEVFTKYCNLSISMFRSTSRFNLWNSWLIIIKECCLSRGPVSFFKCYTYWNNSWSFSRRRSALDIMIWDIFSRKNLVSKFTLNKLVLFKVSSDKYDLGSSSCGSLSWLQVKYIRRFVVIVNVVVISKLLIV